MSQTGLAPTLPLGIVALSPLGINNDSAWDPLEFLYEEPLTAPADLEEIRSIGRATKAMLMEHHVDPRPRKKGTKVYGSEVGDDRLDASRDPAKLAAILVVQQQVVGMRTSEEDTALTTELWNFCEVTSFVPRDQFESFDFARRTNMFPLLGFIDAIVLRLIMDVSKGEMSHSSTPSGKMSLVGAKVRTPRSEFRLPWMMASWMQDAFLSTHRANDPKYLPGIMGGMGVPPLYDNGENLFLFSRAYRGGGYHRIYGTCTQELRDCLQRMETGQASVPFLCQRMSEKQEYFHGTYAEKVFIPKESNFASSGNLPIPLYEATGGMNRTQAFENRLLRTRHIVTRSEAVREQLHSDQLRNVLMSAYGTTTDAAAYRRDIAMQSRARYGMALSANTALQNLLLRKASEKDVRSLLGNDAFRVIMTGQREFSMDHAIWLTAGGKTSTYSIFDLTTSEDVFIRSEVSLEESFKVPGIPLLPIIGRDIRPTVTRSTVGLYQINGTMMEWAERIIDRLTIERDKVNKPVPIHTLNVVFNEDPEWVNDDSHLIRRAIEEHPSSNNTMAEVILVSSDRRLANQMSQQSNKTVRRLEPSLFLQICHEEGIDSQASDTSLAMEAVLRRSLRTPRSIVDLYIDTGSLSSAAAKFALTDHHTLVKRDLIRCGRDSGKRYSQYRLTSTVLPASVYMESIRPIRRQRVYRQTSRGPPSSGLSDLSGSWRSNISRVSTPEVNSP
jgi:hypothetical protein